MTCHHVTCHHVMSSFFSSRGNFLRQAIPLILEELITTNPLMRKGMPLNYLALPNGHSNPQQPTTTQPIDDVISETTPILMNLLSAGTMYMKQRSSIDFISSRLPPYYGNRSEIGPKGIYIHVLHMGTPLYDEHPCILMRFTIVYSLVYAGNVLHILSVNLTLLLIYSVHFHCFEFVFISVYVSPCTNIIHSFIIIHFNSSSLSTGISVSVMSILIIVLLFFVLSKLCIGEVITLSDDAGRIRGFTDANSSDITLGALFAVHDPSPNGDCGPINSRALERIEAFLYSIDSINSDPNLLPNVTLGYTVRDTCTLENIGLDETLELVFNTDDSSVCVPAASGYDEAVQAIIGPTTSHVATAVAGFLRLFNVPQVSYSASSPALGDRNRYSYFYRTIPPDDLQAQAMIDLILKLDWSLVNVIHSNDEYGEAGTEMFRQLANARGICIDNDIGIDESLEDYQFASLAAMIYNDIDTDVIVFFASRNFIAPFMSQIDDLMITLNTRELWWIASESWAQSNNIVHRYHDVVAGRLLGLAPQSTSDLNNEFTDYLSNLTLSTNTRNPWFTEFIEHHYNCTNTQQYECPNDTNIFDSNTYSITPFMVELVIESVYSVAHAIHDYLTDTCSEYGNATQHDDSGLSCAANQLDNLNGSTLVQYLQNVNFTSAFGKQVYFDRHGNPSGAYEITNYLPNSNDESFSFTRIGIWEEMLPVNKRLQLFTTSSFNSPINSSCPVCREGSVKVQAPTSCCQVCLSCMGRYYGNSSTTQCSACPDNSWGNNPLIGSNSCVSIQQEFLSVGDGFGIALLVLACLGTISVVIVVTLMVVLWNTSVIKSSGREQMTMLLCGVLMCFLQTIFFLVKPSITVCTFQRAGTWFCFSIILSALLVKLIRIVRIFLRKNSTSKPPRFIKPFYQVLFSSILVAIQMILVLISLVVVYPDTVLTLLLNETNTDDHPTLLLRCTAPHTVMFIILLLYYSVLLIVSNALAVVTLKFPDNFNESKYVAFTTFTVGLVWVAFCVSYFATKPQYHTALFSFGIQLSAVVVLVCFFLPRIINAFLMKYCTKVDLYSTSSSIAGNDKRLSLMIERQNLPHKIAGDIVEDDLSTQTFK